MCRHKNFRTVRLIQISLNLLLWHRCRNGQAQRRAPLHNNISPFGTDSPLPAPPSSHKHLDARPAQPAQQQRPLDPSASHQQPAGVPFGRSTLQGSTSGRGLRAEGGSEFRTEAAAGASGAQGQHSGLGGAGMVSAGRRQGQLQPSSRQTSLGPGGGAGKWWRLQVLGRRQLAGGRGACSLTACEQASNLLFQSEFLSGVNRCCTYEAHLLGSQGLSPSGYSHQAVRAQEPSLQG